VGPGGDRLLVRDHLQDLLGLRTGLAGLADPGVHHDLDDANGAVRVRSRRARRGRRGGGERRGAHRSTPSASVISGVFWPTTYTYSLTVENPSLKWTRFGWEEFDLNPFDPRELPDM